MFMLKVTCDCGANYTVREELAGKKGRCRKCGNTFVIPSAPEPVAADDEYAMIEAAPAPAAMPLSAASAGAAFGSAPRRSLHAAEPREPHDPKRELSKGFYVGGWVAGLLVWPALGFFAAVTEDSGPGPMFGFLFLLALPAMLLPMFCMGLLTYRMWEAIQDDNARCRPASATILLFVPIVNLFWYFKAWSGWAEDYNAFIHHHKLRANEVNESYGKWVAILMVLSIVPLVSIVSIANLFLIPMFMSEAVDGVNNLLRAGHRPKRSSVKGMGIGSMIYGAFGVITLGIMGAFGVLLGIMGLIAGRTRDGEAAPGRGWALGGIGVSLAGMVLGVALVISLIGGAFMQGMETAQMARNQSTGTGLVMHATTASFVLGHIPPADEWFEPVQQEGDSRDIEGDEGHVYAMNALLGGLPLDSIEQPGNTVLFFEAARGSGISGGRDLLPMFPQHRDDGFLVVFVDGSVRMIPGADEVRRLIWTPVLNEGGGVNRVTAESQ
jgi:hypothetical protein